MQLNINMLILLALILFYIAFYLMIRTIINKFSSLDDRYVRNHKRLALVLSLMNNSLKGTVESLREIKSIKENLILDEGKVRFNTEELNKVVNHESKTEKQEFNKA